MKAFQQLCYMLDTEKPDLAVFTGDVVTGIGADSSWVNFMKPFDERGIPFVVTLGNHDREQELTERQIADIVMSHPMSLNTAKSGWLDDMAVPIRPLTAMATPSRLLRAPIGISSVDP